MFKTGLRAWGSCKFKVWNFLRDKNIFKSWCQERWLNIKEESDLGARCIMSAGFVSQNICLLHCHVYFVSQEIWLFIFRGIWLIGMDLLYFLQDKISVCCIVRFILYQQINWRRTTSFKILLFILFSSCIFLILWSYILLVSSTS